MSKLPKYAKPQPFALEDRKWPSKSVEKAPIWVSVDLRDGNQALPNPLSPEAKLEYFKLLCDIGFKEIEVAFPSASAADFEFTASLVQGGHIPDDVFIMGLTQCRESLIRKTFEAFKGVKQAIVHSYIATSDLHMKRVFNLTRDETIKIAVDATKLIRSLADDMPESDIRHQFSPEEFTDTDIDFAVEICEKVFEAWGKATPEKPLILNLPATVERRPPNQYADMVEIFCNKFKYMDSVIISVHSHNDQGMALAATEMCLLAGATRVEGTMFGYGERTGNIDLITMACNMLVRGIDPGLDFSRLPEIAEKFTSLTEMQIYYRLPYSGELVFTAFSGSHQDAIRKGMMIKDDNAENFGMNWKVPYLLMDPMDVGRGYDDLIRINSQSGKGGSAYLLEHEYGYSFPKGLLPDIGKAVQKYTDKVGREIKPDEVYNVFFKEFVSPEKARFKLGGYWPVPDENTPSIVHGKVQVIADGETEYLNGTGNGPLDALVSAIKSKIGDVFSLEDYHESAIGHGSGAQGVAYISLLDSNNKKFWGIGQDSNISQSGAKAIFAALNRMLAE